MRKALSRIIENDNFVDTIAKEHGAEELFHASKENGGKMATHLIPETPSATEFGQEGLKERTGDLLGLVNEKGEHHQEGKDDGEMILAMAKVMFKVVALVLEGVEGFVFDFPAGASPRMMR